jgi:potassium/chloride transporter 4/5/6
VLPFTNVRNKNIGFQNTYRYFGLCLTDIEYAGAEKEWGDGLKGLALSAARFALLNVDSRGITHTRNWRPQLVGKIHNLSFITFTLHTFQLVLYPSKKKADLYSNLEDTRKGLLAFVAQLKAGKGLTLVAECVEGQFAQMAGNEVEKTKDELYEACKASRIRGFCDVLVAEQYIQGVSHLIQTSGLGGLRHNRYEINQLFMNYDSFKQKKFSVFSVLGLNNGVFLTL